MAHNSNSHDAGLYFCLRFVFFLAFLFLLFLINILMY